MAVYPITDTPGQVLKTCTEKETASLRSEWMKIYCRNKQGANTKDYLWHIFSYERYPALSGQAAIDAYLKQQAPEFIVLSNDDELAIETDLQLTECGLSDFYVFPRNMAWTMAFTHEDSWLGPYFAVHPDKEKLDQDNLNKIAKLKEIEKAKRMGWM